MKSIKVRKSAVRRGVSAKVVPSKVATPKAMPMHALLKKAFKL